jgi:serine/threonine protein phosphatase PrpC
MDPHLAIWEHCLELAVLSDVGLRRPNNQDSLAVVLAGSQEKFDQRGHLFMVADGMGAHAAGELASKLATDIVPLTYNKLLDRPPPEALRAAVQAANDQIHSRGMASDDFRGMGTTVSALVILPQGAMAAHVGDSRIYRLRGDRLEQLTFDHSLVWELQAAGQIPAEEVPSYIPKNIITRSLGPNPETQVDLEGLFPLEPGDTFLLCSDGLSGQVPDEEIGQVLAALPPQEAARILVDLANLRGGPDNITVIVVRVTGPQVVQGATPEAPSGAAPAQRPASSWVLTVAGLLALAAAGLAAADQTIAAIVSLIGAAVAAGVALRQRYGGTAESKRAERLGKGPHTSRPCPPQSGFVSRLAGLARELREATVGTDWTIDWPTFNAHESRAATAGEAARYADAVAEYCRAVSFMMAQLRSQQEHKRPGDDSGGVS